MNRLTAAITRLKSAGKKAFVPFIIGGYPDLESMPMIVTTLERSGASIVEIGIPFSDPLADGNTIQSASYKAIQNGVTPDAIFQSIQSIRKVTQIPIIIFSYTNLILTRGLNKFMQDLSLSGADGVLVPDLPLEEAALFKKTARQNGLRMIFLVSPLTSPKRMKMIEKASDDFVYCISVKGVTGKRESLFEQIEPYLQLVRETISKPIMVGFGIGNRKDAEKISALSDGVVVGSALIDAMDSKRGSNLQNAIQEFAEEIYQGIN